MHNTAINWIGWHIPCILAWVWLGVLVTRALAPDLVNGNVLLIGLYPVIVAVIHLFRGSSKLLKFLFWLAFFPLIASYWCIKKLDKPYKLVKSITHPLTAIAYLFVIFVCTLVNLLSSDSLVIYMVSIVLVLANILLVTSGTRWAINPVRLADILASEVYNGLRKTMNKTVAKDGAAEVKKELDSAQWIKPFLDPLLERLESHVASSVVAVFIVYFVTLFGVTILSYSSIYYSLSGLSDAHFKGLPHQLPECVLYSISVLTTSPLSGIEPLSRIGKLIYCLELLSTFSLVTLFVSIFSIGLSIQDGSIQQIQAKAQIARKSLAERMEVYSSDLNPQPDSSSELPSNQPLVSPAPTPEMTVTMPVQTPSPEPPINESPSLAKPKKKKDKQK